MSTVGYPDITTEELRSFHSIDRQLYRRLVINLRLDIMQCLHMIALWFWFEELGYPNIVLKMLTLPDGVVQTLAHDALRCINCLFSDIPPPVLSSPVVTEIPLTQDLMENKPISLSILYQDRLDGLSKITETVVDVGSRAFDDIAREALLLANANHNNQGNHDQHQQEGVNNQGSQKQPVDPRPMTSTSTGSANVVQQEFVGQTPAGLLRPTYRVQHPLIYGSGFGAVAPPTGIMVGGAPNVLPQMVGHMSQPHGAAGGVVRQRRTNPGLPSISETGELSNRTPFFNPKADPLAADDNNEEVPPGDRTMFITFSRGYPITERELRNFFFRKYGECIEDVQMQDVPLNQQPLFARVVFRSLRTVADILDRREKAKFAINGKHVWARLHVPKQNNSAVPTATSAPKSF